MLQRIKIRKSYEVRLPEGEAEGVRVLARWNNAAAAPAAVQKVFGRGQVVLWTTAADRGWSDWPTESSYVLAVREAARAIARSTASLHEFAAGQPLRVALPPSHDVTLPTIEVPGGQGTAKPLRGGRQRESSGLGASVNRVKSGQCSQLRRHAPRRALHDGLARFGQRRDERGVCRQSRRARKRSWIGCDREEFKSRWGALEPEVISVGTASDPMLTVRGQEIWRTLASGLLGLLLVEACFARWCGRQR